MPAVTDNLVVDVVAPVVEGVQKVEGQNDSFNEDTDDASVRQSLGNLMKVYAKGGQFKNDFTFLSDTEQLWNASVVLLNYLKENKLLEGKNVLELGSGMGHLGFEIRKLGCKRVICTERPQCLKVLKDSLATQEKHYTGNDLCPQSVMTLSWGKSGWNESNLEKSLKDLDERIDVVICSELFYDEAVHQLLLDTYSLLKEKDLLSVEKACIYSIFINRPFSWNIFALADDEGLLEVERLEESDSLGLEDLHLHKWTWKDTTFTTANNKSTDNKSTDNESTDKSMISTSSDKSMVSTSSDKSKRSALLKGDEKEVGRLLEEATKSSNGKELIARKDGDDKDGQKKEGDSEEDEKSIWEILDELIGIDPRKLRVVAQSALLILAGIAIALIKSAPEMQYVYLHSGFLFCVICLSASIEFVLAEAGRLQREKEIDRLAKERIAAEDAEKAGGGLGSIVDKKQGGPGGVLGSEKDKKEQ